MKNSTNAGALQLGSTKGHDQTEAPWKHKLGNQVTIEEIVGSFDPDAEITHTIGGYNIRFSDDKQLLLHWSRFLYHLTWVMFIASIPLLLLALGVGMANQHLGTLIALSNLTVTWGVGAWAFSTWIDLQVGNKVNQALAETKQGKVTKLEHLRGLLEVLFALQRCPSWTRRLSWNPAKWQDPRNNLDREVTDRIVRVLAYLYELSDDKIREFGRQDLFDQQINLAQEKVKGFLPLYWRRIAFPGQTMFRTWKTIFFFFIVIGAAFVAKQVGLL